MTGDIDSLEHKIEQVLAMCGQLRTDNHALREQVAGLEQQKQVLMTRSQAARMRLEALMDKLPAEG